MQEAIIFKEHKTPGLEEAKAYFSQRKMNAREAEHFLAFYELKGWTNKNGRLFKSWKSLARDWISSATKILAEMGKPAP